MSLKTIFINSYVIYIPFKVNQIISAMNILSRGILFF